MSGVGLVLSLLVGATVGANEAHKDGAPALVPEKGGDSAASAEPACTFVANLHVRKCSGTTVRNLFEGALKDQGWAQSGGYCDVMVKHASNPLAAEGKHWSETHCNEDIVAFNAGVRALRAAIEPKGCKVVSTVLLREPAAMLKSEWEYFGLDTCNTSTPYEWAKLVSDEELRWAMPGDQYWTSEGLLKTKFKTDQTNNPECTDPTKWRVVKDCAALTSDFEKELQEVDHVGVSDTPENFAEWWLGLSHKAGFTADSTQLARHSNPSGGTRAVVAKSTTDAQMSEMKAHNPCASKAYQLALKRHAAEVATSRDRMGRTVRASSEHSAADGPSSHVFDATVATLLAGDTTTEFE